MENMDVDNSSANLLSEKQELLIFGLDKRPGYIVGFKVSGDGLTMAVIVDNFGAIGQIVQIYVKKDDVWEHQATLSPNDKHSQDQYTSLDISYAGNIVVLGAPTRNDDADKAGAVYLFVAENGIWHQQDKATPGQSDESVSFNTFFGYSVALSTDGRKVLVGAPGADETEGAAYLYWITEARQFQFCSKLKAKSPYKTSNYGMAVALSDNLNTVLVGAPNEYATGAVYLYGGSLSAPKHQYRFTIPNISGIGDRLAVSADGDDFFVGANSRHFTMRSRCFHYEKVGVIWSRRGELPINSSANGLNFVTSTDGNVFTALTGYAGAAINPQLEQFKRTGRNWESIGKLSLSSKEDGATPFYAIGQNGDGGKPVLASHLYTTTGFNKSSILIF